MPVNRQDGFWLHCADYRLPLSRLGIMQMNLPSALAAPSVENPLGVVLRGSSQVIRLPKARVGFRLGGKGVKKC